MSAGAQRGRTDDGFKQTDVWSDELEVSAAVVIEMMDVAVKGVLTAIDDYLRPEWPEAKVFVSSQDDARRRVTVAVLLTAWSAEAELAVAAATVEAARLYACAIFIETEIVTPTELVDQASNRVGLLEPTFH